MDLDHQSLKTRHRAERDDHPENLRIRVHRALSWLQRAEMCDDPDGRFIFLWIGYCQIKSPKLLESADEYV